MTTNNTNARSRWTVPLLQGILPLDKSRIAPDIIAGITLAALGIPEVMGYTKIIGTPSSRDFTRRSCRCSYSLCSVRPATWWWVLIRRQPPLWPPLWFPWRFPQALGMWP
jgi:hypothetical protein